MNQKTNSTRGIVMTLVAGTAWGFSGACGQYLFDNYGVNTAWLTTTRLICAGSILLLFCLLTKRDEVKEMLCDKQDMLQVFLFAILGLIFSQYTYLAAISYCNAGTATVLQYVGPVFVMVYVCLRTRTKPSRYELMAVTLALIGTFLLATHGRLDTLVLSPLGLFWGVCSAFAVMFYTLIPAKLLKKRGTLLTTGSGMLLGGIILGLSTRAWTLYIPLDLKGFLALGGIVLIGTVMSYTLYLQGTKELGAVKASMLASVEPVSAALFAFFWLGTDFAPLDILGFVCILTTVFLLAKKDPDTKH